RGGVRGGGRGVRPAAQDAAGRTGRLGGGSRPGGRDPAGRRDRPGDPRGVADRGAVRRRRRAGETPVSEALREEGFERPDTAVPPAVRVRVPAKGNLHLGGGARRDRKSTRLNSSHV